MAIRNFSLALLGSALCAQLAFAQVNTATISGTVRDVSGAVLPGVSVAIHNQDTGISRTVTTNETGRYSAPALGLGNYQVTAQLQGFQSQVRSGIALTVGREAVVDFTLAVGAVNQTVEVTGEAAPVPISLQLGSTPSAAQQAQVAINPTTGVVTVNTVRTTTAVAPRPVTGTIGRTR